MHSWNNSLPPRVCLHIGCMLIIITQISIQYFHTSLSLFFWRSTRAAWCYRVKILHSCPWVSDAWKSRWQIVEREGSSNNRTATESASRMRPAQTGYAVHRPFAVFSDQTIWRRDETREISKLESRDLTAFTWGPFLFWIWFIDNLSNSKYWKRDCLFTDKRPEMNLCFRPRPSYCCVWFLLYYETDETTDVSISRLSSQSALISRLKKDLLQFFVELSTDVFTQCSGRFKLSTCNVSP